MGRITSYNVCYTKLLRITQGSESVWVEVRDQDSGLVLKTNRLVAALERSPVRKDAARLLRMSFRSLRYRLAKYGLSADDD